MALTQEEENYIKALYAAHKATLDYCLKVKELDTKRQELVAQGETDISSKVAYLEAEALELLEVVKESEIIY